MNAVFLVSVLPLLAIFSQGDVERCFYCEGDCENFVNLQERTCDSDNTSTEYLCKASAFKLSFISDRTVKSRLECVQKTEKNVRDCEVMNEEDDTRCYTCDKDLCNRRIEVESATKSVEISLDFSVSDCYHCRNECDNPREDACHIPGAIGYLCQAIINSENGTRVEKRGCVENTEKSQEFCRLVNSDEKEDNACYICDTDLCNDRDPLREKNKPPEPPKEKGVHKCHFCEEGKCDNSREIACHTVISITDYVCQAAVVERNGVAQQLRQCLPNTREDKYACETVNTHKEVSCYTCNRNLCNKKAKKKLLDFLRNTDEGVKKCYACAGQCDNPEEQICDIRSYICQETKFLKDGGRFERERKCVQNTKVAREFCQVLNEVPGISCYTCNKDLCNNKYTSTEKTTEEEENTAGTYSPPAMLLATLVSQFLTKLLTI